jgi:hypothetical protein
MKKQPDRLVRDATRLYDAAWNGRIDQHDCLQVMRRQYAALRRIVHATFKKFGGTTNRSDVLLAMDRWKKKGER